MTDFPTDLYAVDGLDQQVFVEAFGDVAEHSPWVATQAAASRPSASRHEMIAAFEAAVDVARPEMQRALLVAAATPPESEAAPLPPPPCPEGTELQSDGSCL